MKLDLRNPETWPRGAWYRNGGPHSSHRFHRESAVWVRTGLAVCGARIGNPGMVVENPFPTSDLLCKRCLAKIEHVGPMIVQAGTDMYGTPGWDVIRTWIEPLTGTVQYQWRSTLLYKEQAIAAAQREADEIARGAANRAAVVEREQNL